MNLCVWKSLEMCFLGGLGLSALLLACGGTELSGNDGAQTLYQGKHVYSTLVGTGDNAEIVRSLPGKNRVLLMSSKARKLTVLDVVSPEGKLKIVGEKYFFSDDPSESELTSLGIDPEGKYAVATRTIIEVDATGEQKDCKGELVFIDITDENFGAILSQVPVGPMPDAVAISDDGRFAVSADEHDGPDAWGKCNVAGKTPSISVVDVSLGPTQAFVKSQILMVNGTTGPREPEYVSISKDSDRVLVTLQDSHEIAAFDISRLPDGQVPSSHQAVSIVKLPPNPVGADPWPDGILRFDDATGEEFFAVAGEWNDQFIVVDREGHAVANETILERDIPESFPRVIRASEPPFRPDSLTSFTYGGRPYVAVTLRHAGAVGFYDVSDAFHPSWRSVTKVGFEEKGGKDERGSTISPEGICAAEDGRFVVTANEGESSVSLIFPEAL